MDLLNLAPPWPRQGCSTHAVDFFATTARRLAVPPNNITLKEGGNMSERELEDDRPRRREVTCLATGLLAGALLGALAGNIVPTSWGVLIAIGAIAGGFVGGLIAPHLSLDEWNPQLHQHSYVGTNSPDDDIS
jgi:uncharacterized protein YcfJ